MSGRQTDAAHWPARVSDAHPYAGGTEHYAAFLEDAASYEVELVAR